MALVSGLSRLLAVASDGRLGTVSAGFYTVAYVGFGFPLMLASLSSTIDVAVLQASARL